jgi:hypothetical protein
MNECMSRQGFFSLRPCGEPAATGCATCGRMVCARHLSPTSGFTQCMDCTARGVEGDVLNPGGPQPAGDDREWAYGYRRNYYRSNSYAPFNDSDADDSYYDDYDMRSFDRDLGTSSAHAAGTDADDAPDWTDS